MAYKIAIIVGSLREGSLNRRVARSICAIRGDNLDCSMIEIGDLPLYNQDLDGNPPPQWVRFRDELRDKDGVLFVSPEYNRGIPGVLKNALDWASRPFPDSVLRGKPVAVVGASTGLFGAVWAQAETRKVLGIIGADVIEHELPVGQAETAFAEDGELVEAEQQQLLADLVRVLAARAGAEEARAAA